MKNRRRFLLVLVLLLAGCNRQPLSMPEHSNWSGAVELPGEIMVPFRMDLDFAGSKPTGSFIVGDEKTAIPEIFRNGDSVILRFSEYGAEVRAAWNGIGLVGNYLRIRSGGTTSFK